MVKRKVGKTKVKKERNPKKVKKSIKRFIRIEGKKVKSKI